MSTRVLLLAIYLSACSTAPNYMRPPKIPPIPLKSSELWLCIRESNHEQQTRLYAKSAEEAESVLEGYNCTLVPMF